METRDTREAEEQYQEVENGIFYSEDQEGILGPFQSLKVFQSFTRYLQSEQSLQPSLCLHVHLPFTEPNKAQQVTHLPLCMNPIIRERERETETEPHIFSPGTKWLTRVKKADLREKTSISKTNLVGGGGLVLVL